MIVKNKFLFTLVDDNVNWEVKKQVWLLTRKLKDCIVSNFLCDPIYFLDQSSELYQKLVKVYKENKSVIDFSRMGYKVYLTEEEKENAVAFLMVKPEHYCEEYEDISYEWKRCEQCWSAEHSGEQFYVSPKGYIIIGIRLLSKYLDEQVKEREVI